MLRGEFLNQIGYAMFFTSVVTVLKTILVATIALSMFYALRHLAFTYNRLFGRQRHPYVDITTANWPSVTVFVAAHNEEAVIAGALQSLLEIDYPADKIVIMPVNDRSKDRTREIIDQFVEKYPGRIIPFHRVSGKPGKAAALKDATELVTSDIIVVFDADYLPSRNIIKQLVAPFFDPEVGATMGRVVPQNVSSNLLTRLLDLERSGGYQVDQQARMNMGLMPQYGGTVGGIRLSALREAGGWHDDVLAEDTDLTFRLRIHNWKVVYQNRAECYEEVPETWPVRVRQIKRWAKGHNQALYRHFFKVSASGEFPMSEKIDGLALLGVYVMAPLLIVSWVIAFVLYFINSSWLISAFVGILALVAFGALGNFASFFQVAAAVRIDGSSRRIRLLPFLYLGFVISAIAIAHATIQQIFDNYLKREMKWDKTVRYRRTS